MRYTPYRGRRVRPVLRLVLLTLALLLLLTLAAWLILSPWMVLTADGFYFDFAR